MSYRVGLSYMNQTHLTTTVQYSQPRNYSSVILTFSFINDEAIGPAPTRRSL
jgi:hypothetical protein